MKHFKKAFTLIELMVVISVIAILSTIALFGFAKAQAAARDVGRAQIMNGIQAALERYYGDRGYYPISYSNFCDLVCVLTGRWPFGAYLNAYPKDPKGSVTICGDCGSATFTTGGATYSYTSIGDAGNVDSGYNGCYAYTLTLTKESGGIQIFKSPQ